MCNETNRISSTLIILKDLNSNINPVYNTVVETKNFIVKSNNRYIIFTENFLYLEPIINFLLDNMVDIKSGVS